MPAPASHRVTGTVTAIESPGPAAGSEQPAFRQSHRRSGSLVNRRLSRPAVGQAGPGPGARRRARAAALALVTRTGRARGCHGQAGSRVTGIKTQMHNTTPVTVSCGTPDPLVNFKFQVPSPQAAAPPPGPGRRRAGATARRWAIIIPAMIALRSDGTAHGPSHGMVTYQST
jgi:hypothetical protein